MQNILVEENGYYYIDCSKAIWSTDEINSVYKKAKLHLNDVDFVIETEDILILVEYKNANIICESWLLVPELKKLLPEDSNIVKFQNQFIISKVDYDSPAFMDWIYSSRDIEYLNLPENTTLQKNLKKYLLSGKKFGWGYGIYSNFKIK